MGEPEFDKSSKELPAGVRLAKQATGFELAKLLRRKTL
jgi:hypothetical protein